MRTNYLKICALFLVILYSCSPITTDGPYLATGIKIGEVTQNVAIVWVRLTQTPERVGNDAHSGGWKREDFYPEHLYLNVVGGFLEGAVPQINGKPTLIFRHFNPDGELLNE
jgi:hypothetical protein